MIMCGSVCPLLRISDDIYQLSYLVLIFTLLKLCLATVTHNFEWMKIAKISFI